MFARLVRQSFRESQRRTRVALAALGVSAVLTGALLNLYFDARSKVGADFRRYGANLMVTPAAGESALLAESLAGELVAAAPGQVVQALPYLYAVTRVRGESVVLAGTWLDRAGELRTLAELEGDWIESAADSERCLAGTAAARRFGLRPGDELDVAYGGARRRLRVAGVVRTGGEEDNAILVNLPVAQALTGAPGQASVVLARAEVRPGELDALAAALAARFTGVAVKPVRAIAEGEVRVLARIRGMLWATTAVVLLLTALAVLLTMTALATARRREIGLLKALGAPTARIGRLFLAEAALAAVAAGLTGAAAGIGVSQWLGRQIFASAVEVRWLTFPAVVGVTLGVALAGTLAALRLVREAEPAVILREE